MPVHKDKTTLITGASSGIGRALALALAGPGTSLWLVARDQSRLKDVAQEARRKGADVRVVALDLSDLESAGQFLEATFASCRQQVDELYLNAAVSLFGEVKDVLEEDWDRIYRTNLLSCAQWIQAVYPQMVTRGSGTIVLMSSLAGYVGYPTSAPYASMKAGLLGLHRSLRYEAERFGVRVHLVAPGYVDTGIYRSATYRGTSREHIMKIIGDMGFKMISAEQAADTILRGVQKGKHEICFPAYARLMTWIAPRAPVLIRLLHQDMTGRFRRLSR